MVGEYDELGRLTAYKRDDAGRITTIVPTHGNVITNTLDNRGRITIQSGPLPDQQKTTVYDAADRILEVTEANTTGDRTRQYVYNLLDGIAEETDAIETKTRYDYDAGGNLIRQVAAFGSEEEFVTQYTIDNRNRVETIQFGTGAATTYEYFPEGQVRKVIDPLAYETTYELDPFNRRSKIVDAEGGEVLMGV